MSNRGRRNDQVNNTSDREERYANLLDRMAGVIEALTPITPPAPPPPAIAPAPLHQERSVYDRFTNERIPEFLGEPDPLKAETWLQRLIKVFAVIKCPAGDMVLYATHKLAGEAHHWWEMQKRVFNMPDREISWEMFEAAFLEKYFPANLRGQKEDEFLRLRQGNRSVAEYDSKFTELSRYAPFMVEDEERKVRRFFQGLRDDIRRHLSTLTLTTYGEVLAKAAIYEKELERGAMSRQRTFSMVSKASASEGPSKKARPFRFSGEQSRAMQNSRSAASDVCDHCGKSHGGRPCYKKLGVCYNCGQAGHLIRDCPAARQAPQVKSPIPAKVFAISAKEAEQSTEVVEGTISICDISCHVLFDSGSTHSFVSHKFLKHLTILPKVLEYPLMVTSPTGSSVILKISFSECPIKVNEFLMPVNLVVLEMKDFDAILGMDWLARYHAKIDCFRKRVEFTIPGNKPFHIQGIRRKEASCFISALHARHLMSDGCQAYLAFVGVSTENQEALTREIPVVREFEDVFTDDLPGLPPQREIEFGVEPEPATEEEETLEAKGKGGKT